MVHRLQCPVYQSIGAYLQKIRIKTKKIPKNNNTYKIQIDIILIPTQQQQMYKTDPDPHPHPILSYLTYPTVLIYMLCPLLCSSTMRSKLLALSRTFNITTHRQSVQLLLYVLFCLNVSVLMDAAWKWIDTYSSVQDQYRVTVAMGVKEIMEITDVKKIRNVEMINVVWMIGLGLAWIGVFVMLKLTAKLAQFQHKQMLNKASNKVQASSVSTPDQNSSSGVATAQNQQYSPANENEKKQMQIKPKNE